MREGGFELSVGDSLMVDRHVLTVVDIIGDEIIFRIDDGDDIDSHQARETTLSGPLPPR